MLPAPPISAYGPAPILPYSPTPATLMKTSSLRRNSTRILPLTYAFTPVNSIDLELTTFPFLTPHDIVLVISKATPTAPVSSKLNSIKGFMVMATGVPPIKNVCVPRAISLGFSK